MSSYCTLLCMCVCVYVTAFSFLFCEWDRNIWLTSSAWHWFLSYLDTYGQVCMCICMYIHEILYFQSHLIKLSEPENLSRATGRHTFTVSALLTPFAISVCTFLPVYFWMLPLCILPPVFCIFPKVLPGSFHYPLPSSLADVLPFEIDNACRLFIFSYLGYLCHLD